MIFRGKSLGIFGMFVLIFFVFSCGFASSWVCGTFSTGSCSYGSGDELLLSSGASQSECLALCEAYSDSFVEPVNCCYWNSYSEDCLVSEKSPYSGGQYDYSTSCSSPITNGNECDYDSDCQSGNCRLDMFGSGNYYCADSGKECSSSGTNGYDYGEYYYGAMCYSKDSIRLCTPSTECETYFGRYCGDVGGSNYWWNSGDGTDYVCSTTNHCYSGTYYDNYVCNGGAGTAGSCSGHSDPIEPDTLSNACSCGGDTWVDINTMIGSLFYGSNEYCCGDDGSVDDFYHFNPNIYICQSCSDGTLTSDDYYLGNGDFDGSLTTSTSGTCYYGSMSCDYSGGSDGDSVTLYGNGYLYDSLDRCYYGDMSCGDGTYSNGDYETCPDSCIDSSDGSSCQASHNLNADETCYYGEQCSDVSGCSYSNSGPLDDLYCDDCTSSGPVWGDYCPSSGSYLDDTCYYGTRSCSGTTCTLNEDTTYADCIDAGDSSGSTCYTSSQSDDCTTSGWGCSGTPTEDNTYASCLGDGDISGSYCYYGSQSDYCTTSGWACNDGARDETKDTSCLGNGDVSSGVCYYGDAVDTCVSGVGWECSSGDFDSTLYSSYTASSCTYSNLDGSNDYCYYDGGDDCYYNSGTSCIDGSGWSFSYESCEDPGYVSGNRCYYDSNGGGESNSCSSSGCTGIDYETTSVTCDVGSLSGGSMGCWDDLTCYYSSDGCDYYAGWDFSSESTACSAGTSTCCTSSSIIYEGVSCSSSGATGSSYDRDSSQARCESTASGCTSYNWDSAQGACCGDDGTSDDWTSAEGICDNGVWTPGETCSVGSDCSAGKYCDVDGFCYNLPTCGEANPSSTGYDYQNSSVDLWDDCSASYDSCSNQYTMIGPSGFCSGTGYSCDVNGGSATVNVGDVCQSGSSVNPSSSTNCGTGAQNCFCDEVVDCVTGSCSASTYYRGFNSASCTDTGKVSSGLFLATDGTSISETTYKVGTSCSTSSSLCSSTDSCYSGTYYTGYTCDGSGNCDSYTSVSNLDADLSLLSCACYGYDWDSIEGACCGDDGTSDDWTSEEGSCVDGVWTPATISDEPIINSLILNSSFGTNTTNENLTVSVNSVSSILDITDWRLNDTSVAVLNMPMESLQEFNSSEEINFVKDYSTYENHGGQINGISAGYYSGNLDIVPDQWGGSSNDGEFDIVCSGGDSNCFFKTYGGEHNTSVINNGVAVDDIATGTGYIMYSQESVHDRFSSNPPHSLNANNYIGVRYSGGQWQYNSNVDGVWHSFSPLSTDVLVAQVTFDDTETAVELDHLPLPTNDLVLVDNFEGGENWTESSHMTGSVYNNTYNATIITVTDPFFQKAFDLEEIYDTINIRYKSYSGGPSSIMFYYVDGTDCSSFSSTCSQSWTITSDGAWHEDEFRITDAEWVDDDGTISNIRFDLDGSSSLGSVYIDSIYFSMSEGGVNGENAYFFDGSDYILTTLAGDVNNLFANSTNSWSTLGWFKKSDAGSTNQAIFGLGGGTGTSATYVVFHNSAPGGKLMTRFRGGDYGTIATGTADGNWHMFAVVWNGSTMLGYYDDQSPVSLPVGTAAMQVRLFTIGATANGGNTYFEGMIDNALVFDRDLSEEQINQIYQDGLDGKSMSTWVSEETQVGDNYTVFTIPSSSGFYGENVTSNWLLVEDFTCSQLTGKKFEVRNSTGDICFEVNQSGDAVLYGHLQKQCSSAPVGKYFEIRSDSGRIAWINDSCYMCVQGEVSPFKTLSYVPGAGNFYVQDTLMNILLEADSSTGNLFISGKGCSDYASGNPISF